MVYAYHLNDASFQFISSQDVKILHHQIHYCSLSVRQLGTLYTPIRQTTGIRQKVRFTFNFLILFANFGLCFLDKVQSITIRLINNPNLAKSLQSLSYYRSVVDLSIFYRYFHGDFIPFPNYQKLCSLIPITINTVELLSLLSPFLASYNFPSVRSKISKFHLISPSAHSFSLSPFVDDFAVGFRGFRQQKDLIVLCYYQFVCFILSFILSFFLYPQKWLQIKLMISKAPTRVD